MANLSKYNKIILKGLDNYTSSKVTLEEALFILIKDEYLDNLYQFKENEEYDYTNQIKYRFTSFENGEEVFNLFSFIADDFDEMSEKYKLEKIKSKINYFFDLLNDEWSDQKNEIKGISLNFINEIKNKIKNNEIVKLEFTIFLKDDLPKFNFTKYINAKIKDFYIKNNLNINRVMINLSIFGRLEIINKIMFFTDQEGLNEKVKLDLYSTSFSNKANVLKFGDDNSKTQTYITVIKANSLKSIIKKLENTGELNIIFAWNVREYFKDNKVDAKIKNTLLNSPTDFFTLNNGLTIIGEDINHDGDNIKINKMCILNGAQTTTIVSSLEDEKLKNVGLFAKIIDISNISNSEEKKNYISNISQASNNQKPIKIQDLLSQEEFIRKFIKSFNDSVTGNLKYPFTFLEKKGFKSSDKNNEFELNIEKYIKIILVNLYGKPGKARSAFTSFLNKDQTENFKIVQEIFDIIDPRKPNHLSFIKDILYLEKALKSWTIKNIRKINENEGKVLINNQMNPKIQREFALKRDILKNSKLFFESLLINIFYYYNCDKFNVEKKITDSYKSLELITENNLLDKIFIFNHEDDNFEVYISEFMDNWVFDHTLKFMEKLSVDATITNITKKDSNFIDYFNYFISEMLINSEFVKAISRIFRKI